MEMVLKNPKKELRDFGLLMAGILAGVFGWLLPWWKGRELNLVFISLAAAFAVTGLAAPLALAPVFRLWMKIGLVLGWINSRILLGAVFYLLVLPTGVVMRWRGKDPMSRSLDRKTGSYRNRANCDTDIISSMERPF